MVYPLQPDQREFFCIVKKVNDARNHEDKIIIFFLHIVTGNGGLWQVSEAPKYFGGGLKKRTKFSLPPHSPPAVHSHPPPKIDGEFRLQVAPIKIRRVADW